MLSSTSITYVYFLFQGVCPYCGVFYGNLGQHVGLYCPKNPNRQRAYHCCYCKFRSCDRATLLEHKATHVLARDFKCEICDSSFFTRQRLVRHMRYVHLLGTNPVRIYTCDRCGKRFRYHSHYDRHLTIHSGMSFFQYLEECIRVQNADDDNSDSL